MMARSKSDHSDAGDRVWAVIAFVPEDFAWFSWLYRHLEGYPVPTALLGQRTRHGIPLPERFGIFPDRWNPLNFEQYPEALQHACHLIVVCSPHSANSPWIDDLIREFKGRGGEERVIALVTDDSPDNVSRSKPQNPTTGLPGWLRWRLNSDGTFRAAEATEPLIIDARSGRTELEFVREQMLAALVGVSAERLEHLGGLTPPMDVTEEARLNASAEERAQRNVVVPSALTEEASRTSGWTIRHSIRGAAAAAALVAFAAGAGYIAGRNSQPLEPPVLPVAGQVRDLIEEAPVEEEQPADEVRTLAEAQAPAPAEPPVEVWVEPAPVPAITPEPPPPTPVPVIAAAETAPQHPEPAVVLPQPPPTSRVPLTPFNSAPNAVLSQVDTASKPAPQPANAPAPATEGASPIALDGPEVLIRGEMFALIDEGDRLAEYGYKERVIDAYTRALNAGKRYVEVRPDDTAARLRLGGACVRVGGLQSELASAAEARKSLELGRRVLVSTKVKGDSLKERNRLLEQIDRSLRRLAME